MQPPEPNDKCPPTRLQHNEVRAFLFFFSCMEILSHPRVNDLGLRKWVTSRTERARCDRGGRPQRKVLPAGGPAPLMASAEKLGRSPPSGNWGSGSCCPGFPGNRRLRAKS